MALVPRILICQCSDAEIIPRDAARRLLQAVSESGHEFEVADLCLLAARRDPRLKAWAREGALKIAACYPRSIQWLFAAADAPLRPGSTQVFNLRSERVDAIIPALVEPDLRPNPPGKAERSGLATGASQEGRTAPKSPDRVVPDGFRGWFPVIDFDRCTQCMECLGFCLFGVFGVSEARRLEVRAPENCKNNCPACARICPEAAIIFPKFKSGPINGEAIDENPEREKIKVDISALLGGDIYARLRNRSAGAQHRFSTERDPDQARQERQRCLAKLVGLGAIPPEVLASLPSADEMQRRADQAQAKLRSLQEPQERP